MAKAKLLTQQRSENYFSVITQQLAMSQREAVMGFLKGVKAKLEETKQGISDMNDRRKISNLVSDLAKYPLCSENDAYLIVESAITNYLGRSHIALIDLVESSPEEVAREMAELDVVMEKERELLTTLLSPEFKNQLWALRGSIAVCFLNMILVFLEDTELEIDQNTYAEILTVMVKEASGFDAYLHFTSASGFDIYYSHRDFKQMYFPKLNFPQLEETGKNKYQNYLKTLEAQESEDDNSIASALANDRIGDGRSIDLYNHQDNSWSKGYLGSASVPRMVEYCLPPRMLRKQLVASIYSFSNTQKTTGDVHWHFCEDGILQVDLAQGSQPRWISAQNIEDLTFGEGYNGLSKDGRTEFEHFYLYMTVTTVKGDEFTLFRFIGDKRKNAERNFEVYMNQTLPLIADYYTVYTSDNVYDISKHYKTTYTTTYVWGEY
jgi:hypothetical protein